MRVFLIQKDVKMKFMKLVIGIASLMLSAYASAGPDQLDVIGLIPGVSTPAQVRAAGKKLGGDDKKMLVRLEIGGHLVPCAAIFINGKLSQLVCMTGENQDAYPTKASNEVIHVEWREGFTKKFGEPDDVERIPQRTRMGVEVVSETVIWNDSQGNRLHITSSVNKIDEGLLMLISSESMKRYAEEEKAKAEARKKF
jgi:hypothetical protein